MSVPVVLDATAGVALVLHAPEAEWVGDQVTDAFREGGFVAVPEHFWVETAGVLRRQFTHGTISEALFLVAVGRLGGLISTFQRFRIAELIDVAVRWRHNLTVADALYVALAQHLNAEVVTADMRLARAPNLPVTIRTPDHRPPPQ